MSPGISTAYLSAMGITRWRRLSPPPVAPRLPDTVDAGSWRMLQVAASPRCAFLLGESPDAQAEQLMRKIARAMALAEHELAVWYGSGPVPEAARSLPLVVFGGDGGEAAVSAPSLRQLATEPEAKAALWRELQARILPHL
ncbi:MAG: DNA polymerase III subunit psi [Gammaproteobacteria bacterium]|nr:DNA polymerase III subunit psi [Gammaproteobacteria bacterium]